MDQEDTLNYRFILDIILQNIHVPHFIYNPEEYKSKMWSIVDDIMYFICDDTIASSIDDYITIDERYLTEKYELDEDSDLYSYKDAPGLMRLLSYVDFAINVFNKRPYPIITKLIKTLDDTLLDIIWRSSIEDHITVAYMMKLLIRRVFMTDFINTNVKIYALFFIISNMSQLRGIIAETYASDKRRNKVIYTARALMTAREMMNNRSIVEVVSGIKFI